jgi:hypothetical protein
MVIKPQYRAHIPLPNFNQLEMKHRYSFKPFGDANLQRKQQNVEESPYRNTLQADTMYFRQSQTSTAAIDMQHALVDPSHTFHQEPRKMQGRNKSYMVYDLKPKGKEMTQTAINHTRRVTYGIDGKPIVRLVEQRDLVGETKTITPVEEYLRTKSQN